MTQPHEIIAIAIPEGQPKVSIDDEGILKMLQAEWAAMSKEEREKFTEERFQEFEVSRKKWAVGKHTLALNAFRDVSDTVMKVETAVSGSERSSPHINTHNVPVVKRPVDAYWQRGPPLRGSVRD